jgi:outer membrane protein assembly factor BamA
MLLQNPSIARLADMARTDSLLRVSDIKKTTLDIINSGTVSYISADYIASEGVLRFVSRPMSVSGKINWVGNETVSDDIIRSSICFIDAPDRGIEHLQRVYKCMSGLYRDLGYDLMEIDSIRYHPEMDSTTFYISEGLISRVMITGNERTRGWVIKRNFTLKPGEPFNLEAAERGMANIYSTGLFERVNFDVERRGNEALVRIEVKEKKFDSMRIGVHYHDHYHAETFADFSDANVLGLSNEVFFRIQYGERRKYYSLNLKADRIFETYLTYRIKLYHQRLKRDIYEDNTSIGINRERRTGATVAFGQQISRFGTVTVEARADRLRIDLPGFAGLVHRGLRTLTLRSRVDNLDRYPYPKAGVAAQFYLELAYDAFGGEDRYKKAWFDWSAEIPMSKRIGLEPSFAIGVSDVALPSFEKFYLGGNRNLYGYHYDALSGDKLFRGNFGVRYALPYGFYVTGRYDVGNVWGTLEEVRFNNLIHCYGAELSYDSPIGPISVSYGRSERGYERAYIDVGYDF